MRFHLPIQSFRTLIIIFLQFSCITAEAQKQEKSLPGLDFNKLMQVKPALLENEIPATQNSTSSSCVTSTFYLNITAAPGEKINIKDIQTLADGNFLLTGNIILPSLEQEGLLCIMNNSGSILQQQRFRVNGNSTTLFAAKAQYNGNIFIAGIVQSASNSFFVARLNSNLTTTWTKSCNTTQLPAKVVLDILPNSELSVAAQTGTSILSCLFDFSGSLLWQKQMTPAGMDILAGVGHSDYGEVSLVVNCTRAGKKVTEIITFDQTSGGFKASHTLGLTTDEYMFHKVSSFENRFIISGVKKAAGGPYVLAREIMYNSNPTETVHTYGVPLPTDFSCTAAHDNSGDGEGFCFPQLGKLVFIRQLAYYQTFPERTIEYNVPVGSSIAGISRSLVDGGYLFGLNSLNQDTVTLIKTDSIGVLVGCGYNSLSNNYSETIVSNNTPTISTYFIVTGVAQNGNITNSSAVLNLQTVCNQPYCPPSPPEDTCLSTYFKTLRSNSHSDGLMGNYLLNNNTQLCGTLRQDRILETGTQTTFGLKLFSERGDFIKGAKVFANGESTVFKSFPADDHHVMILHYTTKNIVPTYTFSLVNDSMQVVWSRPVQIFTGYNFFSPVTFGNMTRDSEGNFYYVANTMGIHLGNINEDARVLIYKLDPNGNEVWLKVYEIPITLLNAGNSITATNSSLVIVVEGSTQGSISLQIDKNSGQMLHAYTFPNNVAGAGYDRFLKFDRDRVYYGSNDASGNGIIGIFDTTAFLIKMKKTFFFNIAKGAADVKDGKLYLMRSYYNGGIYKDAFIKTDSALNLLMAKEYNMLKWTSPSGIWVSNNGSIYTAGDFSFGGINGGYYDPYFRKFDTSGNTGTCAVNSLAFSFTDYPLTCTPLTFTPLIRAFTPGNVSVVLTPDYEGPRIAELLCSSSPLCNSVDVTGLGIICQLNQPFTYKAQRNPGCNLPASWSFDTTYAVLQNTTDSTAAFKFIRTGNTRIYAKINTGCNFYIDSIDVLIQNVTGNFSLGADTILCPGDTLRLNAGTGFSSYLWQNGSTDSVFIARTAGQYYVSVTNLCGNTYKDTINISASPVPYLSIGKDSAICKGDTLHLSAQPGFNSYTWFPAGAVTGTGSQVYCIPLAPVSVWVKAVTAAGCSATDTINITSISAPSILLGNDTAFCITDSLRLNAGPGFVSYLWSTASTNASVIIKQAGSYWVKATAANGCIARDSITILPPYPLPQPKLGADFSLCLGDQKILNPGNFSLYKWHDGSTASTYTVRNPGSFHVTVTDSHKCIASDTVIMLKMLPVPANFLKAGDTVCQYASITITPLKNFNSYLWSNGGLSKTITVSAPGNYTLTVTDSTGCAGKDTIMISGKTCITGVFIPNAFTPNKDNLNDIFKPRVYGVTLQYKFEVYNRYGEPVFITTDPLKGWDGTFKGDVQPGGAYNWQCWYQLQGAEPVYKQGSVILMR